LKGGKMAKDNDIYRKLSEEIPPEAIQRTKSSETKKGYDTTGYGYQYAVNRFNDILGLDGWGYDWEIQKEIQGQWRSGGINYEIVVRLWIWIGDKADARPLSGSHLASSYGDALKGAITNAFKKTAAMWGVGKKAYEGTIDDDSQPRNEGENDRVAVDSNGKKTEESEQNYSKHEEVGKMLMEMLGDKQKCEEWLRNATEFEGRDNKIVKGKRHLKELSQAQLDKVVYPKAKREYVEWRKENMPIEEEPEPVDEEKQKLLTEIMSYEERLGQEKFWAILGDLGFDEEILKDVPADQLKGILPLLKK